MVSRVTKVRKRRRMPSHRRSRCFRGFPRASQSVLLVAGLTVGAVSFGLIMDDLPWDDLPWDDLHWFKTKPLRHLSTRPIVEKSVSIDNELSIAPLADFDRVPSDASGSSRDLFVPLNMGQ